MIMIMRYEQGRLDWEYIYDIKSRRLAFTRVFMNYYDIYEYIYDINRVKACPYINRHSEDLCL